MHPLPHATLRLSALALVLGAGLATPRAVDQGVSRADSRRNDAKAPASIQDHSAALRDGAPEGYRPTPVPCGTPPEEAPHCSLSVSYADDVLATDRVTLTDVVYDRACPAELNSTVGVTFEVDNARGGRNLWWRRAETSFDVLYPSSGSIAAAGKSRVSLRNLVLDQAVTIDVLDGDQRLMSFTLKHF